MQLEKVAKVMSVAYADAEQLESAVVAVVRDVMLARRLIVWLPEVFGMVLVSHMDSVTLPTSFCAKDEHGQWIDIALTAEPIIEPAVRLASTIFHHGPRGTFKNIAERSAVLDMVNSALNKGGSIQGATISNLRVIDIPAEIYLFKSGWNWRKPFG